MYYLKKIYVLLGENRYETAFKCLAENLRDEGIACGIKEPDAAQEILREKNTEGQDVAGEGILWITDHAAWARTLLQENLPVLVFLHDQNRGQDLAGCRYAFEQPQELDAVYLDRIYRRYRRLPWDILETGRCLIRETTQEDVEDFYRIYAEPSITRYMEGLYEDPEEERAYARDYIDKVYAFYDFGIWTVTEKRTGQVIGRAGICYREGYAEPELGFVIAKPWQKKGYATEVCRAILDYAKEELGFDEVLAFVETENKVSLRLCEKLGMCIREKTVLQGKEYLVHIWH